MNVVRFVCSNDNCCNLKDSRVEKFNAFENYDMLNEFFGKHDKNFMQPKEEYFSGFDFDKWEDYVMIINGEIAARAEIWKKSDDKWEVAGVSTAPEYRKMGYGVTVVRYCIAEILGRGRVATCTTKKMNTAMIRTALKAGFVVE